MVVINENFSNLEGSVLTDDKDIYNKLLYSRYNGLEKVVNINIILSIVA